MNLSRFFKTTSIFSILFAIVVIVLAFLVNTTALGEVTWLRVLFGVSALNFMLRASIPLILGALSGILCERTGIINIGIEGMMLAGAFTAFVAKVATNDWPLLASLLFALLITLLTGALMGYLHALLSIRFKMDQIISGTVLIILASGFSAYLFDRNAAAEGKFGAIRIPILADIPVLGEVFFRNPPITYLALILVVVVHVGLFYTRWGLRTRAVAVGQFQEGMTTGRGFISLAAMIFGNWNPFGALGASLLFGYTQALQNELLLAGVTSVPRQFVSMIPYVVTIIAMSGFVGRVRPPAVEGKVYETESK